MRTVVALTALVLFGCEAVPDITFSNAVDDASSEAASDASTNDAGTDGVAAADADADAPYCPIARPAGASVCCGPSWCGGGFCEAQNCARCATCDPMAQICCSKLNNITCQPLGSICH